MCLLKGLDGLGMKGLIVLTLVERGYYNRG